MRCEKINIKEIEAFSSLFVDYIDKDSSLGGYYSHAPSINAFEKITSERKFDDARRQILHTTLNQQYEGYNLNPAVRSNIDSLKEHNTFTVSTGHQLNIFTGPLYFVYKILTVINTCEILNKKYPDSNFVPVYWMASEDHDLDEIQSFTLFGKKYTWETDQEGAVGRMDPASITEVLNALPERVEIFENAYLNRKTLSGSVRDYVNALFGKYGLVVIDADDISFKEQFKSVIQDDLINHHANDLVEAASSRLSEQGYKAQVYPRAINLFYLTDTLRKRIVKEGGTYKAVDTDIAFDEEGILNEVDLHPERFSPNVILRPLYQEIILPNVAYIGGPAEIAYWLQLKDVFDYFKVSFPVLLPRNFAMVIPKGLFKKMQKLKIPAHDIFKSYDDLKKDYLKTNTEYSINLESEEKIMQELFDSVLNKSKAVDKSLEGFVMAERSKVLKSLENIGKRIIKSEEQKQSVELNQIQNLKEKLFPDGNLQERTENLLSFYINKPDFIDEIKFFFDPFDFRFNIIIED